MIASSADKKTMPCSSGPEIQKNKQINRRSQSAKPMTAATLIHGHINSEKGAPSDFKIREKKRINRGSRSATPMTAATLIHGHVYSEKDAPSDLKKQRLKNRD
jgi:hypothetical protein